MKYFFLLILPMMLFLGSCRHDPDEFISDPADTTGCDSTNVSYELDVYPIIENACLSCHGSVNPSAGISLSNYAEISVAANVEIGNYGSLLGVIYHSEGNSPMPQGADQLSECDIAIIKNWIDEGINNN